MAEGSLSADPDLCKGRGSFDFPNGDKYVGEYCAHRSGIVWREGIGTYTTQDGQTYTGMWRDDKIVEASNIEIKYPDGVQYQGFISKNKYEGPGMYTFENKMTMLCDFSGNKPVGEISLIDIKGRQWHGVAAQDEALLLPEHIYFNNIHENAGKGRRKRLVRPSDTLDGTRSFIQNTKMRKSNSQLNPSKSWLMSSMTSKSLLSQQSKSLIGTQSKLMEKEEMRIFAKTKKTASDLQFENSDWYKNYIDFKAVYDNIKEKITSGGEHSLNDDELKWYDKYLLFKKRYCEIMKKIKFRYKSLSQDKLFELMAFSEEFKNKCPPVPVIYPYRIDVSAADLDLLEGE